MSTDCIIIILSSVTLIVSSFGIWFGWKWHKAVMRQNLEQEQAEIDRELAEIAVQIRREETAGQEQVSKIFGGGCGPNPREKEISALLDKCKVLANRRDKINKQIQQL